MRTTILLLLALSAVFLAATPALAGDDPCTVPPVELRRCGVAGREIYVCGEFHDRVCIWGP